MEQPIKFTVKANKVGNSLKITIPLEVREYLGINKNENIEMWASGNHIISLKKKE